MRSPNRAFQLRRFMARLLKDAAGRLLVTCRAHHRFLRGKAIVVTFHSVTRQRSDGTLRCSLQDLERYCAFFVQHLRVETFSRVVDLLQGPGELSGELAITFDDGYADNAELALEVLERWNLHATFFVSTGFMETNAQTSWDRKANIRSRWMSWAQVAQLASRGHEIGSHTVSHANLCELHSADVASELQRSSQDLLKRIGVMPRHFAVPFGRAFPSLEDAIKKARELGFKSVSLCRGGVADHANSALWIERWPIDPSAYLSPYGWMVDVVRECLARRPTGGRAIES
jgi:peptidoglycan/xylan/chitin deacetylase (PgdA/CDA1 family)